MLTYSGSVHPLTIYLSIHPFSQSPLHSPFVHIPIYPHISLSIHLSLYLSIPSSVCPSIYPPIHIYPSRESPVHWPRHPYIYPSVQSSHPLKPSTHPFVRPVTHLFSVHSSVLSVYWPIVYPPTHTAIHSWFHLPTDPSTHLSNIDSLCHTSVHSPIYNLSISQITYFKKLKCFQTSLFIVFGAKKNETFLIVLWRDKHKHTIIM